jgi:hypothetical protein
MLTELQETIIAKLEGIAIASGIPAFPGVDVWNDHPDKMLEKIIKLPAALVALANGRAAGSNTIPPSNQEVKLGWDVFVMFENRGSRKQATTQGLGLIELVWNNLKWLKYGNRMLVPEGFQLIATVGGKSVYVVNFAIDERM